jgi:hypothetical protein
MGKTRGKKVRNFFLKNKMNKKEYEDENKDLVGKAKKLREEKKKNREAQQMT